MKFISIAALAILSVQAEDAAPAKTCGETFKVEMFTDNGCVTPDAEADTAALSGSIVEQACTTEGGVDVDALCTSEGFVTTIYKSTDGTCTEVADAAEGATNPTKQVEWGKCVDTDATSYRITGAKTLAASALAATLFVASQF